MPIAMQYKHVPWLYFDHICFFPILFFENNNLCKVFITKLKIIFVGGITYPYEWDNTASYFKKKLCCPWERQSTLISCAWWFKTSASKLKSYFHTIATRNRHCQNFWKWVWVIQPMVALCLAPLSLSCESGG